MSYGFSVRFISNYSASTIKMIDLTIVSSLEDFLQSGNIKYNVNYMIQTLSGVGPVLVATVDKFVCHMKFLNDVPTDHGAQNVSLTFPGAFHKKSSEVKKVVDLSTLDVTNCNLKLLAKGTELQGLVWKELLTIPVGKTYFYSEIAQRVGKPAAIRAVASAVGKNPIAYIIPCHRVIGKNCNVLKFGSGPEIKRRLLEKEGISVEKAAVCVSALSRKSVLCKRKHDTIES